MDSSSSGLWSFHRAEIWVEPERRESISLKSESCMLHICPSSDVWFENSFCGLSFHSLAHIFHRSIFFSNFNQAQFTNFFLPYVVLSVLYLSTLSLTEVHKDFLLFFLLKVLLFYFIFRSMIHFVLVFV